MQKTKLNLDQLDVESFNVTLDDIVEQVIANAAPTARTMQCPCYESISCYC